MPRHPLIPRLLLASLLGAATTIALAWSFACINILNNGFASAQRLLPDRGPIVDEQLGGPPSGLNVQCFAATGRFVARVECNGPEYSGYLGTPGFFFDFVQTPPDELIPGCLRSLALPWLRSSNATPWPRGKDSDWRHIQASGWPLLALTSIEERTKNYTHELKFGIAVPGKSRMLGTFLGPSPSLILPLRPLFPGFLLDTLLFATLWWTLLLIPRALRARSRRRRNLCPHCAYDLRATPPPLPCPECGQNQSRAAQAPAGSDGAR